MMTILQMRKLRLGEVTFLGSDNLVEGGDRISTQVFLTPGLTVLASKL